MAAPDAQDAAAEYHVGQRVVGAGDGALATVRYVGPVAGTDGEWVGVEWDDVGRGKHDGTHAGVRYFDCELGAGCARPASFVRAKKLAPGVSYARAVHSKYLAASEGGDAEAEEAGGAEMYVPTASGQKVMVQVVGADITARAQEQVGRTDRVYLPDACVASVGAAGEARGATPSAVIVDLQGNPLPSWEEVSKLAQELPKLRVLNLSRVRGCWPQGPPRTPRFEALHDLILNGSGITWAQVELLAPCLPALQQLHLCESGIRALSAGGEEGEADEPLPAQGHVTCFPELRVLNLEDNAIRDWGEVERLAAMPALQRLHLGGNKLRSVEPPNQLESGEPGFGQLRCLLLANNEIADWSSVDALNGFPLLSEARLSGNPVTSETQGIFGGTRHEVVARVGGLASYNGSVVGPMERKDAEIRYLRRILSEQAGAAGDAAREVEVVSRNPRLADLVQSHGSLAVSSAQGASADDMVELTLRYLAGESEDKVKKLPATLSIGKLKMLCERLFKVKIDKQKVFLKVKGDPVPWPLDNDDNDLYYYGIVDGGIILVDEDA